MLSEAIKHRYQVSGGNQRSIVIWWLPVKASNQVVLKIKDASPDELSSSTFIRFSLWGSWTTNRALFVADSSFPFTGRYVTGRSVTRGSKLRSIDFKLQRVDVLKHHANTVPSFYQSIKLRVG